MLDGQCFRDNSNRILNGLVRKRNSYITVDNCIQFCAYYGYAFAGVESENQCYCGQTAPTADPLPNSECNKQCSGDKSQKCGGDWSINVYSVTELGNTSLHCMIFPYYSQKNFLHFHF